MVWVGVKGFKHVNSTCAMVFRSHPDMLKSFKFGVHPKLQQCLHFCSPPGARSREEEEKGEATIVEIQQEGQFSEACIEGGCESASAIAPTQRSCSR